MLLNVFFLVINSVLLCVCVCVLDSLKIHICGLVLFFLAFTHCEASVWISKKTENYM